MVPRYQRSPILRLQLSNRRATVGARVCMSVGKWRGQPDPPARETPQPRWATAGAFAQAMTTPDEYRGHAEQARKTAADLMREDDKAFWLQMASDMERLVQLADAQGRTPVNFWGPDRCV